MITQIQPPNLSYFLSKPVPYIYYCNGECEGSNKILVINIKQMASKYPKLSVLELNWTKYKMFKQKKTDREINKVFLYYEGDKIEEFDNPNIEELNLIFKKCVNFHNRKNFKFVKEIESKLYVYHNNEPIPTYNCSLSRREITNLRNRRWRLLKRFIELSDDESPFIVSANSVAAKRLFMDAKKIEIPKEDFIKRDEQELASIENNLHKICAETLELSENYHEKKLLKKNKKYDKILKEKEFSNHISKLKLRKKLKKKSKKSLNMEYDLYEKHKRSKSKEFKEKNKGEYLNSRRSIDEVISKPSKKSIQMFFNQKTKNSNLNFESYYNNKIIPKPEIIQKRKYFDPLKDHNYSKVTL